MQSEYATQQWLKWKFSEKFPIHPGRLTWNLQIIHLERKMIFETSMMFHVNLQGCNTPPKNGYRAMENLQKKHLQTWRPISGRTHPRTLQGPDFPGCSGVNSVGNPKCTATCHPQTKVVGLLFWVLGFGFFFLPRKLWWMLFFTEATQGCAFDETNVNHFWNRTFFRLLPIFSEKITWSPKKPT